MLHSVFPATFPEPPPFLSVIFCIYKESKEETTLSLPVSKVSYLSDNF